MIELRANTHRISTGWAMHQRHRLLFGGVDQCATGFALLDDGLLSRFGHVDRMLAAESRSGKERDDSADSAFNSLDILSSFEPPRPTVIKNGCDLLYCSLAVSAGHIRDA